MLQNPKAHTPYACKPPGGHILSFPEGSPLELQAFTLKKPFSLQNCFVHSLDFCFERGRDPCVGEHHRFPRMTLKWFGKLSISGHSFVATEEKGISHVDLRAGVREEAGPGRRRRVLSREGGTFLPPSLGIGLETEL